MTRPNVRILPPDEITPALHGPLLPSFSSEQAGVILPAQLRAARGLLDWNRAECAEAAGISPETVKNIECGTFKQNGASNAALIRAFAARGVEFVNLINFSLQTLSGNKLCRNAHVSGAVLAVPEKDKP